VAERVLVTGGAGFVGLHLARRLIRDGARVTVLDDFSRGRADACLAGVPGLEVIRHDLTNPVPPGLVDYGFDEVYHLAAVVGVARTLADPGRVLRTNVSVTLNLLDLLARNPPGAVFLSSTSEVADGAVAVGLAAPPVGEEVPFVLAAPRGARSAYALSKAVAESLVLQLASRCRVRVGRYFNVYGPRMGDSHVIPQFARRALAGVDPFTVYGAHQTRAFCHVEDAVEATVALMRLPAGDPLVVNIGDDTEEIEIIELARRMLRTAGSRVSLAVADPPPGSPDRRLPDLRLLRALIPSWQPSTSVASGLEQVLAWYRRYPARSGT